MTGAAADDWIGRACFGENSWGRGKDGKLYEPSWSTGEGVALYGRAEHCLLLL